MSWADSEIKAMADSYYQGGFIRCPNCSGPVEVEKMKYLGQASADLLLMCRRCGTHGKYSTAHLSAMNLKWTRDEMIAIVERYWAYGVVKCPKDNAILQILETRSINSKTELIVICDYCGRNFRSSNLIEDDPASFVYQFEEVRELGRGGMGAVILVRKRDTQELFAAKRILPEFLRNEHVVRRFQREARILKKLSHANIVPIRDFFIDEQGGVILMDFMSGGNLTEIINNQDTSNETLVRLFRDLSIGLSYLHKQGVIHRDLKPGNVLIDAEGRARIADFGLAVLIDRDTTPLTQQNWFLGTRRYAAPEQLRDAVSVCPKADIFALGLIAYEIATRKSPYSFPVLLQNFSDGFAQGLLVALNEDPSKRTISAIELADLLRDYLSPNNND